MGCQSPYSASANCGAGSLTQAASCSAWMSTLPTNLAVLPGGVGKTHIELLIGLKTVEISGQCRKLGSAMRVLSRGNYFSTFSGPYVLAAIEKQTTSRSFRT